MVASADCGQRERATNVDVRGVFHVKHFRMGTGVIWGDEVPSLANAEAGKDRVEKVLGVNRPGYASQ